MGNIHEKASHKNPSECSIRSNTTEYTKYDTKSKGVDVLSQHIIVASM